MDKQQKPYIDAGTTLPETTTKAFILGAILSVVLSAANTYLGLFAGLTVSASIPAAVISMAVLRIFKEHNILENNIVQTAASAGESLAAGVIFTFPALVLMGYWTEFNYWETVLVALCGGVLGVLFTVPLRSALIVRQKLLFPEGVATAEVLKSGQEGGKAIQFLVWG
ncbi:MAG: oligopeptide transporter, OPT family, partial [Bacteroidota bacterium]